MKAFLLTLLFNVLRWIAGWLFKLLRPIIRALLNLLWWVTRLVMVVLGLIAVILVLHQLLTKRSSRPRKRSETLKSERG